MPVLEQQREPQGRDERRGIAIASRACDSARCGGFDSRSGTGTLYRIM